MDWHKIITGAKLAAFGALLSYGLSVVIPAMQASGDATLLAVAAVASVILNIARKYVESKNAGT
jgi:hypothetical protein